MWRTATAREPDAWTGTLPALLSGALRGVVIHDLLPSAAAAGLVRRLQHDRTLPRVPLGGHLIGESLGLSLDRAIGRHQPHYAEAAAAMHRRLAALTRGRTLDALIAAALRRMAHPLPLTLARDAQGQPRAPLVFRRLPAGGRIPPHAELEQLTRAPYDDFRAELDPATLLSFFVCLQTPQGGGALRVHDLRWADYDSRQDRGGHTQPAAQLIGQPHHEPEIQTGSLVVFDGGRWFHEVTPVVGARERWTTGGFIAKSATEDRLLFWS